jgi:DNA (cytosine-5)-methyltransferase 1
VQAAKTPTLTEVLSALPELPHSTDAEYLIHDGRPYYNMSTMRHSQRVVDKIAKILPGGGPISYRRLESHEARTLIAGHRAMPVHPRLHRTISVREAAVIQGFPLDYVFCGPKAEQPLQVANAVPPPMAKAVAIHVLASMGWSKERKKAGRKKASKADKLPFAQSANQ